jgi:hypothetical protein
MSLPPPLPIPIDPIKPGYQTSEFWLTILHQVLMILVVLGVVTQGDSVGLESNISKAIISAFALVGSVISVYKYIHSRTIVKLLNQEKSNGNS